MSIRARLTLVDANGAAFRCRILRELPTLRMFVPADPNPACSESFVNV
jgi:hypothetical protein